MNPTIPGGQSLYKKAFKHEDTLTIKIHNLSLKWPGAMVWPAGWYLLRWPVLWWDGAGRGTPSSTAEDQVMPRVK